MERRRIDIEDAGKEEKRILTSKRTSEAGAPPSKKGIHVHDMYRYGRPVPKLYIAPTHSPHVRESQSHHPRIMRFGEQIGERETSRGA